MLAVATSWGDAQNVIKSPPFKGRLAVAVYNSPVSVILSGDADAVVQAKKFFDEEKKFARLLKVNTAYHSHHMLPCGDPYIQALRACGVRVHRKRTNTSCSCFSSVTPSAKGIKSVETLQDVNWRDNMRDPVLFAEAVRIAITSDEHINLAIEVGPHPALKGPATQNISDVRTATLPYCGTLGREKNDIEVFSQTLGFVWSCLPHLVDFQSFEKAVTCDESRRPKEGCLGENNPIMSYSVSYLQIPMRTKCVG